MSPRIEYLLETCYWKLATIVVLPSHFLFYLCGRIRKVFSCGCWLCLSWDKRISKFEFGGELRRRLFVCGIILLFLEDVSTSGAHVYACDHGIPQRPCAFLLLLLISDLGGWAVPKTFRRHSGEFSSPRPTLISWRMWMAHYEDCGSLPLDKYEFQEYGLKIYY